MPEMKYCSLRSQCEMKPISTPIGVSRAGWHISRAKRISQIPKKSTSLKKALADASAFSDQSIQSVYVAGSTLLCIFQLIAIDFSFTIIYAR